MVRVTIRQLRQEGEVLVDRVARGERVTIARGGGAVAELHPVPRPALSAEALLARRRRLPPVDPEGLLADLDAVVGPGLMSSAKQPGRRVLGVRDTSTLIFLPAPPFVKQPLGLTVPSAGGRTVRPCLRDQPAW